MSLAFNLRSFPKNLSYVSSLQPGSSLPVSILGFRVHITVVSAG